MSWGIPETDQNRFRSLFGEMTGGDMTLKLSGNDVRPLLMKSNLDVAKLGKIWVLADIDQDGCLDLEEFIVSMYLTYKALNEGTDIPSSLPAEIIPPSKREGGVPAMAVAAPPPIPPNAVQVLPSGIPPPQNTAQFAPPIPPPAQAALSVDYSALTDLTSTADPTGFGGFSAFSPAPPVPAAPATQQPTMNLITPPVTQANMNLITPPTPHAPQLAAASYAPNVSGPIPNLLTGGGLSVPAAEVPYLVMPDKYQ